MKQFYWLLLLLALGGFQVKAHPQIQDAMWIVIEPKMTKVAVNVSLREIGIAQGLVLSESIPLEQTQYDQAALKNGAYLLSHLNVSGEHIRFGGKLTRVIPPVSIGAPEETIYQYQFEYSFVGKMPSEIRLSETMLAEFPYAAGTPWTVSYAIQSKQKRTDQASTWLLTPSQPVAIPVQADQSLGPWRTLLSYIHHGIVHILTGYDHLLFLTALVIATAGFWEMVEVIIAFTIAHSFTLALCVFGIFRLPPWLVEPMISLSIIFVALENAIWPERSHFRLRLGVAFVFGLVHGLGFSGGLLQAMEGMPPIGIWIALIGFSFGIELGNQIIILPLFGLLALGRRKLAPPRQIQIIRSGSLVISALGVYYLCVALKEQVFVR